MLGRVLVQPRLCPSLAELGKINKPHGRRRGQVTKQINVHTIELPPQANDPVAALLLAYMHWFYVQDCAN